MNKINDFFNDGADESNSPGTPSALSTPDVPLANEADESFLTSAEAAQFLKLSQKGLRGMASKGKIPYYKLGREYRYKRSELLNIMAHVEAVHKAP